MKKTIINLGLLLIVSFILISCETLMEAIQRFNDENIDSIKEALNIKKHFSPESFDPDKANLSDFIKYINYIYNNSDLQINDFESRINILFIRYKNLIKFSKQNYQIINKKIIVIQKKLEHLRQQQKEMKKAIYSFDRILKDKPDLNKDNFEWVEVVNSYNKFMNQNTNNQKEIQILSSLAIDFIKTLDETVILKIKTINSKNLKNQFYVEIKEASSDINNIDSIFNQLNVTYIEISKLVPDMSILPYSIYKEKITTIKDQLLDIKKKETECEDIIKKFEKIISNKLEFFSNDPEYIEIEDISNEFDIKINYINIGIKKINSNIDDINDIIKNYNIKKMTFDIKELNDFLLVINLNIEILSKDLEKFNSQISKLKNNGLSKEEIEKQKDIYKKNIEELAIIKKKRDGIDKLLKKLQEAITDKKEIFSAPGFDIDNIMPEMQNITNGIQTISKEINNLETTDDKLTNEN